MIFELLFEGVFVLFLLLKFLFKLLDEGFFLFSEGLLRFELLRTDFEFFLYFNSALVKLFCFF